MLFGINCSVVLSSACVAVTDNCVDDTSVRAELSCDAQELSVLRLYPCFFSADRMMNETAYLIFADVILAL